VKPAAGILSRIKAVPWLCRIFYDMNFDDWQAGIGMCDGESMASTTGSLLGNTKQKLRI
jgi:hypothetical protein